jgi:hypothetical protein
MHISADQIAGWGAITLVLGCAAGLGLAILRARIAARRTTTPPSAERWRRR